MTVEELIQKLKKYPPVMDVCMCVTNYSFEILPIESVSAKIVDCVDGEGGDVLCKEEMVVLTDEI